jgi:hypothetical protein
MAKRKGPVMVRPANPQMARELSERARGNRTSWRKGRNRANTRSRAMAFERAA